jgi:antitoxin VapB
MVEMALNIKNEEAHRLARELARLQGVSLTEAVITALKDAVKLAQDAGTERRIYDRALRISSRTASFIREQNRDFTTDDLYDENGLPK